MLSDTNHRWICPTCATKTALPFASIEDTEFMEILQWRQDHENDTNDYDDCLQNSGYMSNFAQTTFNTNNCDIIIGHLNIRSIRNKLDEVKVLLEVCPFDIFAVTETHLDHSVSDDEIEMTDYACLRKDRSKGKGGGCLVYYKSHLAVKRRDDLEDTQTETIWLQLKTRQSTNLLIGTIYRPPTDVNFFEKIAMPLEKAWAKANNIIMMGDFNCDLLKDDHRISYLGAKLTGILDQYNLHNTIKEPTRVTHETKTLIDLIVTSNKQLIHRTGTLPLGISDHNLIYAKLTTRTKRPKPKILFIRNYKNFKEETFRKDIQAAPFQVCEIFDDPNDSYWAWRQLNNDIYDQHAPWKKVKIRSKSLPWVTSGIRTKMNKRYKVLKKAQAENKPELWREYKKLRNEVTKSLRASKETYYRDMFTRVTTTKAYWKLLKKATKPVSNQSIGPIKRENGTLCIKDSEKAQLLNDYYAEVGLNLAGELPMVHVPDKHQYIHRVTPTIDTITVDAKRVKQLVRGLKQEKASGPDSITPRLLKAVGEAIVMPLVSIFNISVNTKQLPDIWKTARMTSVFKKGDKTNKENYRPLSNLCASSKMLETLVADTIKTHVMVDFQMVTERQWAYRKGHSTELLLTKLTDEWRTELANGNFIATAFIDFRKAFDSISHDVLLKKLQAFGIAGDLYYWIENYLMNRKQYTLISGESSEYADVKYGVPQGSVLGPLLFALFTSDLPNEVESGTTYLYADDTTIYCVASTADQAVTQLNRALGELNKWSNMARLTIHPKKSEAMLIHRKKFIGPLQQLSIGRGFVKWVTSTRLVGVTIDNKLNWVKHLSDLQKTYANKLALLSRMNFLPKDALKEFYTKVILPSVLYGQILWSSGDKMLLDNMERLHARTARVIHRLPWDTEASKALSIAGWNTLNVIYKRKLLLLAHKAVYDENVPASIKDMFSIRKTAYPLRSVKPLEIPRPKTELDRSSIKYRASTIWNSLPNANKRLSNSDDFKRCISQSETLNDFSFKKEACMIPFKDSDFTYF